MHMTLTLFMAFSILGLDFLLYALFQWTYGERHRRRIRPRAAARQLMGRHNIQNISRVR